MKVLNLEWSSFPSRDREAATLVCNYLRYIGVEVVEGCIYNSMNLISKVKPNAIFMTNIIGSDINFQVAKYIKSLNIPLYTSHAEGDFSLKNIKQFVWGHNLYKEILENKIFFWSERNAYLACSNYDELNNISFISGSIGHDRFIIDKELNINKCSKLKSFVSISVTCWDFSFVEKSHPYHNQFSKKTIEFFKIQRKLFDEYLYEIVRDDKEVIFIIKPHPSAANDLLNAGIVKTSSLPNVKVATQETSILNLLQETDLNISYSSNTSLEAWLLSKPTCTLNPITSDWPEDMDQTPFNLGQNNFNELESFKEFIQNFVKNQKVKLSNEMILNRKKLIKNIIGFEDGLNHVRIGNQIKLDLENNKNLKSNYFKWNFRLMKLSFIWIFRGLLKFIEKYSYTIRLMNEWNNEELKFYIQKTFKTQIIFYEEKNLSDVFPIKYNFNNTKKHTSVIEF
jgi:hypothetical protein